MTTKLLFVDDNKLILKCVGLYSDKLHNIEVKTAACADHALELDKEQGPFDIIISDYNMPGMDGVKLLRKMKSERPSLLCLLQSNGLQDLNIFQAIKEGVIASFINKPILAAEIEEMLEMAWFNLQERSYTDARGELLSSL